MESRSVGRLGQIITCVETRHFALRFSSGPLNFYSQYFFVEATMTRRSRTFFFHFYSCAVGKVARANNDGGEFIELRSDGNISRGWDWTFHSEIESDLLVSTGGWSAGGRSEGWWVRGLPSCIASLVYWTSIPDISLWVRLWWRLSTRLVGCGAWNFIFSFLFSSGR